MENGSIAKPFDANTHGMIVLGKKLENPYSLKNMRKAYANLKKLKSAAFESMGELTIQATDLYIRTLPNSEETYDLLESVAGVELYDYPLDYEILVQGDYYHDPTIPEDLYTWQYFAVKITYTLPQSIDCEILDSLYIPEDDALLKSGNPQARQFLEELEDEALRITGNLPENGLKSSSATQWNPSGTIRVWDDVLNRFIPLQGVKARARRWFTTHVGYTDANGQFATSGFRYDANYSIA